MIGLTVPNLSLIKMAGGADYLELKYEVKYGEWYWIVGFFVVFFGAAIAEKSIAEENASYSVGQDRVRPSRIPYFDLGVITALVVGFFILPIEMNAAAGVLRAVGLELLGKVVFEHRWDSWLDGAYVVVMAAISAAVIFVPFLRRNLTNI